MTGDYVAFHAAERPDALAMVVNGHPVSHAQLAADIAKFAQALRRLGVRHGSTVAVEHPDIFTHWLLLLACERVGACSISWIAEETRAATDFLADFDLVLSREAPATQGVKRHQAVSEEWMSGVAALPRIDPEPALPRRPEDPLRILRTSGTTGSAKRMLITRRIHEAWIARWLWFGGFSRHSRFLTTMPFTVGGGYASATAVLRAGATIVIDSAAQIYEALAARRITHAVLPPIQLQRMLDALPADFARPAELTLFSFGAPIAPSLRQRALERLASELWDLYGSNEAGFISSRRQADDDGAGSVWPGIEVEIVDDDDRPLPPGAAGRIRVRNDWLVAGYIDDDAATQKAFKGGWFHPGDAGVLRGERRLQVLGRADELLNIGWVKLSPDSVEAQVLLQVPVGDVGACSIANREGIEEICVAVSQSRAGGSSSA